MIVVAVIIVSFHFEALHVFLGGILYHSLETSRVFSVAVLFCRLENVFTNCISQSRNAPQTLCTLSCFHYLLRPKLVELLFVSFCDCRLAPSSTHSSGQGPASWEAATKISLTSLTIPSFPYLTTPACKTAAPTVFGYYSTRSSLHKLADTHTVHAHIQVLC
jgi:hypothetical protein